MLEALRNVHAHGVPLVEAVAAATSAPARIARRTDLGTSRSGRHADVVVRDDRLEVKSVVLAHR
jgi:N-acetylglucosamine-6-phosphate deacetylase